jgi:16S rRNA (adenine1518-N6/adenine1519-N6)-dimethyltransferase
MAAQPITITEVKALLDSKRLAPLKSLGQNFLTDRHFLDKIVKTGDLSRADLVLEIGPGLGGLTERLAAAAGQVVAVEYDRGLFAVLQETMGDYANLTLINRDILTVDLQQTIVRRAAPNYKVIANLPYYITTPIIFKLLESQINWKVLIFLVQKEVAARIGAKPGTKEYGALTVMLNFYGPAEIISTVPKGVFYPAPQVDSAVIKLTPAQETLEWGVYPYLQRIVRATFGKRRKTVLNALAQANIWPGEKKAALQEFLINFGIDPGQRGETITAETYLKLARELQKQTQVMTAIEGV